MELPNAKGLACVIYHYMYYILGQSSCCNTWHHVSSTVLTLLSHYYWVSKFKAHLYIHTHYWIRETFFYDLNKMTFLFFWFWTLSSTIILYLIFNPFVIKEKTWLCRFGSPNWQAMIDGGKYKRPNSKENRRGLCISCNCSCFNF